ncbi:MAG: M64 family metallopeptidase [Aliishimia sp.]
MTLTTLIDNGDSTNRVDMIFLGDGYTADEISTTYFGHVNGFIDYMFSDDPLTSPFHQYQNFFNVHVIEVVSNESGVDDPANNITRDTALDSTYQWDGVTDRLLYLNSSKASSAMFTALDGTDIGAEMRFVTMNSEKYGGGGGYYAAYAGGNASAYELALHEVGHSFAGLADEYYANGTTYTGSEPRAPNSTIDPTGSEWSHWLGYDDPELGVVGVYEGSSYKEFGVYRPTESSKMRSLNKAFDPIAKEAFVLEFYSYVDPLDTWTGKGDTLSLIDPLGLNVTAIDDDIIDFEWSVDGITLAYSDSNLDVESLGLSNGFYEISLLAYDNTGLVRINLDEVQQVITWNVEITRDASTIAGSADGDTLTGTGGNDTLLGMAGDDRLQGKGGMDVLNGGEGGDTAIYESASAGVEVFLSQGFSRGGAGRDTLIDIENAEGSAFADQLVGTSGDNLLKGLAGNDVLTGNGGNDSFDGGSGADALRGGSGIDMMLGGLGADTLQGFADDDKMHGGGDNDLIYGGSGNDKMHGNGGQDQLRGSTGNDMLFGGNGTDSLFGGDDNDVLSGDAGGDILIGGGGSDTLIGGWGSDSLTGGDGLTDDGAVDTFVFSSRSDGGGGIDRIKDFSNGTDMIDLQSYGFGDFTNGVYNKSTDTSAGLRIEFAAGDVLFVENFLKADFDASDVVL